MNRHDPPQTSLRKSVRALTLAGLVVVGEGCRPALRPLPDAAAIRVPDRWRDDADVAPPPELAAHDDTRPDALWWAGFGDPSLTRLVDDALARNVDLLAASARVEQAEAQVGVIRAQQLPALDASVGGQRSRSFGELGLTTVTALQPQLRASWQADAFGRLRRLSVAARAQADATRADRAAVGLAVAAQAARSYIGLLALDAQLRIAELTVATRSESLRVAMDRAETGYSSQFELAQARSEFEAVSQSIPRLQLAIRAQENALRTLVGELPAPVERSTRFEDLLTPPVPRSLPAGILRRRPDLMAAEQRLVAVDASLAAARAQFLPQVSLSASAGRLYVDALDYDPLTVWDIGGSLLAPLFSAGRLRAQFAAATAQRDQAAFAYRQATLAAFADVENALTGADRYARQLEHARARRDALQAAFVQAQDRYHAGYASQLEQLDAQRNLYAVELDIVALRQAELANRVSLYQAIGGGWP